MRIGLANQTTMLRDETLSIGKMLEKVMMQKYGPAELKQHYMVMDTICDATQVWPHPALLCATASASLPPAVARSCSDFVQLLLARWAVLLRRFERGAGLSCPC